WNSSAQPTLDSCLIRVLGYESGGHQEAIKSLLIIQPDGMCVSVCLCNYRAGGQAKDVITLSHTQDVVRLQPYSARTDTAHDRSVGILGQRYGHQDLGLHQGYGDLGDAT
ncbi:MAG: hypothetical protein ACPIOQ_76290, partial [Promethearchaeia archaeon]